MAFVVLSLKGEAGAQEQQGKDELAKNNIAVVAKFEKQIQIEVDNLHLDLNLTQKERSTALRIMANSPYRFSVQAPKDLRLEGAKDVLLPMETSLQQGSGPEQLLSAVTPTAGSNIYEYQKDNMLRQQNTQSYLLKVRINPSFAHFAGLYSGVIKLELKGV